MPVKNFEFSTIDARRFSRSTEVQSNIQINVKHEMTQVIEREDGETEINFRFAVNYNSSMGSVASIKLEGFLVFIGETGLAQKWIKDKKLPEKIDMEVQNLIMRNCIMQGVVIARDMRLPPPVQLPQVKPQPDQKPQPYSGAEFG